MKNLEELLKIASDFVEEQKSGWNHNAWVHILGEYKKRGVELTGDIQKQIGLMLEALKDLTNNLNVTDSMNKLSESTIDFINDTKGKWDHTKWELFLRDLSKKGLDITERSASAIGVFLESAKTLYSYSPRSSSDAGDSIIITPDPAIDSSEAVTDSDTEAAPKKKPGRKKAQPAKS